MPDRPAPEIYSIAAHRGFADALVAGLVPRYSEDGLGLARLTLLLPSARTMRTVSEAFIRHSGETGSNGLLMPRMAVVGDLDLDEKLGPLLDPLGAADIPPAVEPMRRLFELARILREVLGEDAPPGAGLMRLARETAQTMDRLLVEEIAPDELLEPRVLDIFETSLAEHWQRNLAQFARVQQIWLARLGELGRVDAATRRNMLFDTTTQRWRADQPENPIVAAGVTSAAPALARLLRVIAHLPNGAVILPDLDLSMSDDVWAELGSAGQTEAPGETPFGSGDAITHPQYHLKLLLNRMDVNRAEVRQWHRRGIAAAPPERTHAISSLFLPPESSKSWAGMDAEKRRLSGVRIMQSATPEDEAQAIAILVREALEEPEKRVAVVTPDRSLARRIAQNLGRWNIVADDSAGKPLNLTPAGRLLLQLAQVAETNAAPIALISVLAHPLVKRGEERRAWLANVRAFERRLRGPPPSPGLESLRKIAAKAGVSEWWDGVEPILASLNSLPDDVDLADAIDVLVIAAEKLAGEGIWSQEDGRSLAALIDDLRLHARDTGTAIGKGELEALLRDAFEQVAVRPPYGGHPRVAIYGLLESRMTRADLVICCGLNEGTWPPTPSPDPLLAPAVLRALGVPGIDFRIGLSAHDLAAALGAPEVVLSRAARDMDGPAIPSRFLLRVQALLGPLVTSHEDTRAPVLAAEIDRPRDDQPVYTRPRPKPSAEQRDVPIKVTALDRLLGDPYQFYASEILGLSALDPLDAEPSPAWQGTVAHLILQRWHEAGEDKPLIPIAESVLDEMNAHPLMRGLWRPRLFRALENIAAMIAAEPDRKIAAVERKGEMERLGVKIYGRADRIDRMEDGSLGIVDYKTGSPPSTSQVEQGFALQLGLLGLIAEDGGFGDVTGEVSTFEYWSLAKKDGEFAYVATPLKVGNKRTGIEPEEFLPMTEGYLNKAIRDYIKGSEPFTAKLNPDYKGYNDYDQLMRLEEWQIRLADTGTDEA